MEKVIRVSFTLEKVNVPQYSCWIFPWMAQAGLRRLCEAVESQLKSWISCNKMKQIINESIGYQETNTHQYVNVRFITGILSFTRADTRSIALKNQYSSQNISAVMKQQDALFADQ